MNVADPVPRLWPEIRGAVPRAISAQTATLRLRTRRAVSITIEYRTIAGAAGYADWSDRGRLRLDGPDSISFLQALVTNDLGQLRRGQGAYAAYLTPQGRMIADLEIFHRGDSVICGVAPGLAAGLVARLDLLIFAEDTKVIDVSAELAEICITGGEAAGVTSTLTGLDSRELDALPSLSQLDVDGGFVCRSGSVTLPSFRLFVPSGRREEFLSLLSGRAVGPISPALLEAMRIADGRPAWGAELDESIIPLEAGLLDRAISTTKGCYVGQEVIIRILHRGGGRVAKRLVQLKSVEGLPASDSQAAPPTVASDIPARGTRLTDESGSPIGKLTSVGEALDGNGWVALAYVSREAAEVGRVVRLEGTETLAHVHAIAG